MIRGGVALNQKTAYRYRQSLSHLAGLVAVYWTVHRMFRCPTYRSHRHRLPNGSADGAYHQRTGRVRALLNHRPDTGRPQSREAGRGAGRAQIQAERATSGAYAPADRRRRKPLKRCATAGRRTVNDLSGFEKLMDSFIQYRPEGVYIIEREGMNRRYMGGLNLYTPRPSEEVRFRMTMEARLRQIATPGTYTGQEANQLIQSLYAVAHSESTRVLPKVASRNFFEFLVFMHRQWGHLLMKLQRGELDDDAAWAEVALERRTIRYLLEKSVQIAPQKQPAAEREDVLLFADRAYIAARLLVDLSDCSDRLRFLYHSDKAEVIVLPPYQKRYFEFRLNPAAETGLQRYRHMKQE